MLQTARVLDELDWRGYLSVDPCSLFLLFWIGVVFCSLDTGVAVGRRRGAAFPTFEACVPLVSWAANI